MSAEKKLEIEKETLRQECVKRRKESFLQLEHKSRNLLNKRFAEQFFKHIALDSSLTIAAYWPINFEVNCHQIMGRLMEIGHEVCLPVVTKQSDKLTFRSWQYVDGVVRGSFGTWHPPANKQEVMPSVILAPLLAFGNNGERLGYGGGYYDRTISILKLQKNIIIIGLAYEAQKRSNIPLNDNDQKLDWVVTEETAYSFV